jgi:tetratricopeptide (TPR) repeat protein
VFYLGTTEQFEFPKTELLATGVLVMVAIVLSGEIARFQGKGRAAGIRATRARVGAGLRSDPLGAAILLFLVSSIASTVISIRPDLRPSAVPIDRIRSEFGRAIALEPANANVLELASQAYLELGRTAEARAAALRCAALFPDFALPMADIGVAALLEGRAADAADTLGLALRRNWHGQGAAQAAAERNYSEAIRERGSTE